MTSVLSSPLSRTMAMTARSLNGPVDVDELLDLICLAAIDSVPGAEYAGTVLDATPPLARRGTTTMPHRDRSRWGCVRLVGFVPDDLHTAAGSRPGMSLDPPSRRGNRLSSDRGTRDSSWRPPDRPTYSTSPLRQS